ncbi:MAG: hypothetical protein Q8R30_00360 [bacterium]|nr:hypothetical protein [bacterium]MDZ4286002.1 hypothetical protein [Candidatus Sungbacteria bacterium]
MANRKIILCVADAPGPAEFLAPVIPLLKEDYDVHVIAVSTAKNVLKEMDGVECNDESQADGLFRDIKPDLLVFAISSLTGGPYVNNKIVQLAHDNNIPVICLQDIWGNQRWPQNKNVISRIDAVCVPDDFAASLWKEDGFTKDIFVTGSPAFDRFASVDVGKERVRLRTQLGIGENERVMLYAGQGTPHHIEQDKKTFAYVADAIRALSEKMPIALIARYHPRAVETGYYKKYSYGIKILDTSVFEFADEILPAADIVVAMSSTSLLHACYLRIFGVSVLLPQQGRALLKQIGLDDFPPNIMGATVGVYDEDPAVFVQTLERIFTDELLRNDLRKAQEKIFPLDGGSAERVAKAVIKFL